LHCLFKKAYRCRDGYLKKNDRCRRGGGGAAAMAAVLAPRWISMVKIEIQVLVLT
jgi:hypothetical protein